MIPSMRLVWLRIKLRGLARERQHYLAERRGLRAALLRVAVDEQATKAAIAAEMDRQRMARFDRMWTPPFRVPPRTK